MSLGRPQRVSSVGRGLPSPAHFGGSAWQTWHGRFPGQNPVLAGWAPTTEQPGPAPAPGPFVSCSALLFLLVPLRCPLTPRRGQRWKLASAQAAPRGVRGLWGCLGWCWQRSRPGPLVLTLNLHLKAVGGFMQPLRQEAGLPSEMGASLPSPQPCPAPRPGPGPKPSSGMAMAASVLQM